MGKSWDTKKVNEFIEYFDHAAHHYMECLGDILASYESYRNNDTFVGGGAEQSKAFIGMKQEEYNRLQYELSKDMVKRYTDLDETFKVMVDSAPDAKIDTDVVKTIKSHFMEQYEEFESVAFAIQNKSMEAEGRFKKYCSGIEEVYVRDAVMYYDEFCNTGGFLDDCIKKVEGFDSEASKRLNRSGLKNAINEHIAEMMVTTNELDSIQVHTQSVSKQTLVLAAFGSALGVKGVQDTVNERKALDAKIDKWLSPNYKLSAEEIKEAQQLVRKELSSIKFDPLLGCPILRTEEEKKIYKRYIALENKVSKLASFMMGVRKPIYNLFDFTLDCSDFIMEHTIGSIINKGSNLIDHCFGTDTNKYIYLFVNSYKDFRGDFDEEMGTAIENSKLQNSKEFGYGEAAGILLLYYITSEISATLEFGKNVGFVAKQAKENIQDLVLDTRELYQELSKDGELSKSDWMLLGENVVGNFSMNLFFGGFSEVTDILKPGKELHLKKVEKVVEEAENVKKIEKTVTEASDVTKVAGDTAENIGKTVVPSKIKPSGTPDICAKPSGNTTKISKKADATTARSLMRENEAAETLAQHGYKIEQNPVVEGTTRSPDYRIEGELFDCYSPEPNTSARSIGSTIKGKVVEKQQAERVILNLDDWAGNVETIEKQLNDYPIEGLKEVIIVKNGDVVSIYP